MGTRADFYIGCGKDAQWIGSVAWDGYEWAEDRASDLMSASSEADFRAAVEAIKTEREDFTSPDQGWPWPWDTSATTDYVYFFNDGRTSHAIFDKENDWPDMSTVKNVAFNNRSGAIFISA